jgi:hypothetical protein
LKQDVKKSKRSGAESIEERSRNGEGGYVTGDVFLDRVKDMWHSPPVSMNSVARLGREADMANIIEKRTKSAEILGGLATFASGKLGIIIPAKLPFWPFLFADLIPLAIEVLRMVTRKGKAKMRQGCLCWVCDGRDTRSSQLQPP